MTYPFFLVEVWDEWSTEEYQTSKMEHIVKLVNDY